MTMGKGMEGDLMGGVCKMTLWVKVWKVLLP